MTCNTGLDLIESKDIESVIVKLKAITYFGGVGLCVKVVADFEFDDINREINREIMQRCLHGLGLNIKYPIDISDELSPSDQYNTAIFNNYPTYINPKEPLNLFIARYKKARETLRDQIVEILNIEIKSRKGNDNDF